MSISLFISRFIYRIRYQLLFGSIIVTCLVAYFTQFMPKSYTVKTSIYTGIVSGSTIDDGENANYTVVNNTFDNLISLVTAQSSLDNVALNLFAMNMINGNPEADNKYITAKHFKELQENVPNEVMRMIDKSSVTKTVENLKKLKKNTNNNFVYTLLNGNSPHYSYSALNRVEINRVKNSDMIEISYTSDDPGITTNTVKLFNENLLKSYNDLRYNSMNDVISYFEREVAKLKAALNQKEDVLTDYNVQNNVINYIEQTKAIAISYTNYEDRYEETKRKYDSYMGLLQEMEKQMDTRTKLFYTNKAFIKALDDISTYNGKITDLELFTAESAQKNNPELEEYKEKLKNSERNVASISTKMDEYKYTKEGLAISDLAQQWINALVEKTKVEAEMNVLNARREEFRETYARFSPVETEIKRRERDIGVTESSYLEMLHALNLAYLKKKNIQLTTTNLNTISEPTFPLLPNKSKRLLFIIAAFFGSLIFITLYKLLVEILDRTLRDGDRTKRLTGVAPIGAFVGRGELRFRGYSKTWNRVGATYICGKLNSHLNQNGTSFVTITSIEPKEGKSYVAKFMAEEWTRLGLKVKVITVDNETIENASYILAKDYSSIIPTSESNEYDIVILEYPALQKNNVPKAMIEQASVNIIVANAQKVWKGSDNELLTHFETIAGDTPYALILNNADRSDVEDYTGELPPPKAHHSLAMRLMHMGLTSKNDQM
ncbi:MAG: hypothetical protein RRY02_04815 [Muribaculaceae bacterium]